jgi:hypothetical protein
VKFKPKPPKKDISTVIELKDLIGEDGYFRLNPFKMKGKIFRLVGCRKMEDGRFQHSVKNESESTYSWVYDFKIESAVMNARSIYDETKKQEELIKRNQTIEEVKAVTPNQINIFDVIGKDVKIEKEKSK